MVLAQLMDHGRSDRKAWKRSNPAVLIDLEICKYIGVSENGVGMQMAYVNITGRTAVK